MPAVLNLEKLSLEDELVFFLSYGDEYSYLTYIETNAPNLSHNFELY